MGPSYAPGTYELILPLVERLGRRPPASSACVSTGGGAAPAASTSGTFVADSSTTGAAGAAGAAAGGASAGGGDSMVEDAWIQQLCTKGCSIWSLGNSRIRLLGLFQK